VQERVTIDFIFEQFYNTQSSTYYNNSILSQPNLTSHEIFLTNKQAKYQQKCGGENPYRAQNSVRPLKN